MANDPLFGWDLTFKTVEKDIKRKSDVMIAFIHWNLTRRGFRSIGIGDERTLSGDEEKSELLPTGWNDNDNYTVRYVLDGTLYLLHGLNTDGNLIINLMRSEDLAVSNIAFRVDDTVQALSGSVDNMLPNNKDLIYTIKRDLIDTVTQRTSMTAETQTRTDTSNSRRGPDDPLRMPRPMPGAHPDNAELWMIPVAYYSGHYVSPNRHSRLYGPQFSRMMRDLPPAGLPNVGRSDLDPFAPIGGGMLFNPYPPRRDIENPGLGIPGGLPRRPNAGNQRDRSGRPPRGFDTIPLRHGSANLNDEEWERELQQMVTILNDYRNEFGYGARGAVPPGARFDPFAPPPPPGGGAMPGRRPPPDADHLPPPGFNDHMFHMGAVPPGARFDPFAPPPPPGGGAMPGRRPPPDADHLPPPGFNDHMFM